MEAQTKIKTSSYKKSLVLSKIRQAWCTAPWFCQRLDKHGVLRKLPHTQYTQYRCRWRLRPKQAWCVLLPHTQYRCRWRLRPKFRHLAVKRVWFFQRLDKHGVLLPHTQFRCRWRLRPKLRHLAIKRVWFCKSLDKHGVLLPRTQYRCRWRLRPKFRHQAIKKVWFCKSLDKHGVLLPYTRGSDQNLDI